ncbi:MAG: helix-turn-helix domain-containing protein [Polyangiaceae bacterium]|nr:helix-turn-helix domain-containing protein [Polyangiaceae bacterium]
MRPLAPDKLLSNVGRRIAELRVDGGLTQEALAERLDVTTRWIQSAEAGTENLTLTTLARFANALKVPITEFFSPPAKAKPRPGRPRIATR